MSNFAEKKTVLEIFKSFKELEIADGSETPKTVEDILPYFCKKIDEALLRLEAIDNSEPSEFNIIYYKGQYYLQINVNDDYATKIQLPLLEDELKDVQLAIDKLEQVKRERDYFKRVLSIIKEKNVHLDYLNECSSAKQYNKAALLDEELSDEEFNLLKEYSKK